MKQKLTILLLLTSLFVAAQTKLDSLVFQKINEYRIAKGLNALVWSSSLYKAAQHHSEYLVKLNRQLKSDVTLNFIIGHFENQKVDGILSMSFEERINKFYRNSNASECVAFFGMLKNNFEKGANSIIYIWKRSPQHNAILLEPNSKFGVVSCDNFNNAGGISTFVSAY
ncbi:MAG: CAP domain-containing protein [Bacteroidetes bacterium]|nr:CAP domain-containing protein [Bacteroidota bacterium]